MGPELRYGSRVSAGQRPSLLVREAGLEPVSAHGLYLRKLRLPQVRSPSHVLHASRDTPSEPPRTLPGQRAGGVNGLGWVLFSLISTLNVCLFRQITHR